MGLELEYFLVELNGRRIDRARRRARHAREALLRPQRPHAQLRLPDDGLALRQRARLGQLRERPRGRERPVRAELHVHGRAHELRPRDLLPLHGAHNSPSQGPRRGRTILATFMPKPFTDLTGNGCHFHMSLWDGDTNLFLDENDPRGLGLSEHGLPLHRRPEEARAGLQRRDRADGQLVQAAQGRLDVERRDLVAGLDQLRLQQPHPDAPDPRARPRRGQNDRRRVQPLPRGSGHPRAPASTGSRPASTRASRTARTSTRFPTTSCAPAASRRCRPTSSTRPRSSSGTTSSARRSAGAGTRTTSTTSSA